MESDYDDGYGSDLMGDEEDRARLAGLTELDREMELADRAEAREKELERRQTVRALKQQQRKTSQVKLNTFETSFFLLIAALHHSKNMHVSHISSCEFWETQACMMVNKETMCHSLVCHLLVCKTKVPKNSFLHSTQVM